MKKTALLLTTAAVLLTFSLIFGSCGNDEDDPEEIVVPVVEDITFTPSANGGPTALTTKIDFVFSADPGSLQAEDIVIAGGPGAATKGELTGSGTDRSLAITATTAGEVTVSIGRSGIETVSKDIDLYTDYTTFKLGITDPDKPVKIVGYNTGTSTPATSFTSDYTVNWGDGDTKVYSAGTDIDSMAHTYAVAGTYNVTVEKHVKNNLEWFTFSTDDTGKPMEKGKDIITGCDHLNGFFDKNLSTVGDKFLFMMFCNCTLLVEAPAIPQGITTTGNYFLYAMFYGCTSLEEAPAIPQGITTIDDSFLVFMFHDCTSLKEAPAIPQGITNACDWFLARMFYNCTSLEVAPAIPQNITNAKTYFLLEMFGGCTSLKTLMPADSSAMPWAKYSGNEFKKTNNGVKCFADCTLITSPVTYDNIPAEWR